LTQTPPPHKIVVAFFVVIPTEAVADEGSIPINKKSVISPFGIPYMKNHNYYVRNINDAIKREKELKGWRRDKKVAMIEKTNAGWKDAYGQLIGIDPSSATASLGMTA